MWCDIIYNMISLAPARPRSFLGRRGPHDSHWPLDPAPSGPSFGGRWRFLGGLFSLKGIFWDRQSHYSEIGDPNFEMSRFEFVRSDGRHLEGEEMYLDILSLVLIDSEQIK